VLDRDQLYQDLHRNRAEVRGRGHDWDVADVLAVVYANEESATVQWLLATLQASLPND
jgi:hypothetical protein